MRSLRRRPAAFAQGIRRGIRWPAMSKAQRAASNGCPTWIRTMTRRVKVACATITPSGKKVRKGHAAPPVSAVKAGNGAKSLPVTEVPSPRFSLLHLERPRSGACPLNGSASGMPAFRRRLPNLGCMKAISAKLPSGWRGPSTPSGSLLRNSSVVSVKFSRLQVLNGSSGGLRSSFYRRAAIRSSPLRAKSSAASLEYSYIGAV
jgi:hypothetical protein